MFTLPTIKQVRQAVLSYNFNDSNFCMFFNPNRTYDFASHSYIIDKRDDDETEKYFLTSSSNLLDYYVMQTVPEVLEYGKEGAYYSIIVAADYKTIVENGELQSRGVFGTFYRYGEYPKVKCSSRDNLIYSGEFLKGNLMPTGKVYHFDYVNLNRDNGQIQKTALEYVYEGKKIARIVFKSRFGLEYDIYYEVKPLTWYNEYKGGRNNGSKECNNYCLTTDIVMSGLRIDNAQKFIDDCFAKDIIARGNNIFFNNKNNSNNKSKTSDIQSIINSIKEELELYQGDEDIKVRINTLVQTYNDRIKGKNGALLQLDNNGREYLYKKLLSDLNEILTEVRFETAKIKKYKDMLDLIGEFEEVLDKAEDVQKKYPNAISNFLLKIKLVILPFLDSKEEYDRLRELVQSEKEKIMEYIRTKNENGYIDLEDFEYSFRVKLQEFLISISEKVRKKDLLKEISNSYLSIMRCGIVKAKNNYLRKYMTEIREIYNFIISNGSDEEKQEAKIIISGIDYDSKDIVEIMESIDDNLIALHRIFLDIVERQAEEKEIDNYTIEIKL